MEYGRYDLSVLTKSSLSIKNRAGTPDGAPAFYLLMVICGRTESKMVPDERPTISWPVTAISFLSRTSRRSLRNIKKVYHL